MLMPAGVLRGAIITGTTDTLNGHAVSVFADVDSSNRLNNVGFLMSGAAVRDPGTPPAALYFTLPSQGAGTGFQVLELDWNPHGHEPPGVYDLPHFDFHFYYISDSERMAIPANATSAVAPQFLPAGYSQPGPTVPMMGGHAVDLTSAEFNGGIFSRTLVYGFHEGREIFVEPMITQAYLEGLSGASTSLIRQPGQYDMSVLPSLVPTSYRASYDLANDQYSVSVSDFIQPTAVPEPASLSLLVFPITAVIWLGARRSKVR
ncbi:MAG: hypothetical protein IT168_13145 [Bryobacterales bacterium]|nr:hypothetical protein [Bryobacterales bacterium]